jgi:hypothetical protein
LPLQSGNLELFFKKYALVFKEALQFAIGVSLFARLGRVEIRQITVDEIVGKVFLDVHGVNLVKLDVRKLVSFGKALIRSDPT